MHPKDRSDDGAESATPYDDEHGSGRRPYVAPDIIYEREIEALAGVCGKTVDTMTNECQSSSNS